MNRSNEEADCQRGVRIVRLARTAIVALVAITLVIVALIALPRVASKTPKPSWHTIAVYRGDSNGTTAPFAVAARWRVRWRAATGTSGPGPFGVVALSLASGQPFDLFGDRVGAGQGIRREEGSGLFALQVRTDESYVLTVETWTAHVPTQPHHSWRTVATYRAHGDMLSPALSLKRPWRVVWSAKGNSGTFAISVLHSVDQIPSDVIANLPAPANGESYEYETGSFRLDIAASGSYAVIVQQGSNR